MLGGDTILVVEDDENDLLLLGQAFKEAGVANPIQVARNGFEAIQYLKGEHPYEDRKKYPLPHLVLLDVKLPICNGFEVLAWWQTQSHFQSFPIVMLSGSCLGCDSERALALGATAFCVKPIGLDRLVQLVRELREQYLKQDARPFSHQLEHCKSQALLPWAWLFAAFELLKESATILAEF